MYIGRYYHTIESKGRVSLPKKFRDQGEEQLIITRGFDGGLYIFPSSTWATEVGSLTSRTFTKKDHRDVVRLMTNDAQEVEIDNLGRVLIPEYLREYAQLKKRVVLVGSMNKIEIWDAEKYHQYIESLEKNAEQITERISESNE